MTDTTPLLTVDDLRVELTSGVPILADVSLRLGRGEILGLVGESGSGKSTLALALLGFVKAGGQIAGGDIQIAGQRMLGRSEDELRGLRGHLVSYVPQDPASSLNPARRIGDQVADRIAGTAPEQRLAQVRRALERAQLPSGDDFLRRFPHQLSGGQQQRVLIAMAIVAEPSLIVLDEPTTGLDVVTQARFLEEILRLRDDLGAGVVYVSHDLAAVGSVADTIAVMYAGRVVEQGPTKEVLARPLHPYALGLMESVPDHTTPLRLQGLPGVAVGIGEWPSGCSFAPRCPQRTDACVAAPVPLEEVTPGRLVRCIHAATTPAITWTPVERTAAGPGSAEVLTVTGLHATHTSRREEVVAASDISFAVGAGECVALVGESGSGKTTIARCLAGLHAPSAGTISLHGRPLPALARQRDRQSRRELQFIFQNPYESLNPRHRVVDSVSRAAVLLAGHSKQEAEAEAARALERVRLPSRIAQRYPGELSGGERQRVAIARALVARPDVLICDEITSALDVSVQAAVLDLLDELRTDLGLAMLFITHDLGVVASAADRVLVLNKGVICESRPVAELLVKPEDEYTRMLLAAAPRIERDITHEQTA